MAPPFCKIATAALIFVECPVMRKAAPALTALRFAMPEGGVASAWVGDDCDGYWNGYSASDMAAVRENCPRNCGSKLMLSVFFLVFFGRVTCSMRSSVHEMKLTSAAAKPFFRYFRVTKGCSGNGGTATPPVITAVEPVPESSGELTLQLLRRHHGRH